MNAIYNFFAGLMSLILSPFVSLCNGNYALAISLFTLFISLVFIPLNIKQQKASAQQARLRHKLAKLKEECGSDTKRFQEEQGRLMQEAGTNPMAGCLPMLLRLPFFIGIYTAIRQPLTYIMKISSSALTEATKAMEKLGITLITGYEETSILANYTKLGIAELDKIANYDFTLFGIDLTRKPEFTLDFASLTADELILWIIPFSAFITNIISTLITTQMQKRQNPEMGGANMGCMLVFMPLFSLWITFGVPCAVGFYWTCSNVVNMLIQIAMQFYYSPAKINAKAEAKEMKSRREYEQSVISRVD